MLSAFLKMNSSKSLPLTGIGVFSNTTCPTEKKISVFFSVIFMTVGILSNSLAIAILMKAYQRFRQKSKASFLLFASGLVITDLLGHLITGTIAVFVYASDKDWIRFNQSNVLCSIFGMCMVFFGLCPLFLGSVMAVERCIGVTKPIFHSTKMTSKHVKLMLTLVCFCAIFIALLPILRLRAYQIQASRTWCFYRTEHFEDWEDRFYLLLFSCLGLLALAISFVCNAVTGITLLRVKFKTQHRQGRSHHFEMIIQLLAIMCVSCICWSPFLFYWCSLLILKGVNSWWRSASKFTSQDRLAFLNTFAVISSCIFAAFISSGIEISGNEMLLMDDSYSYTSFFSLNINLEQIYATRKKGDDKFCRNTGVLENFMDLLLVTMANIGINGNHSSESCETILFALRMATWNQILDPWVYILLRKAVLKKLFQIARRFCGMHLITFPAWELSSIKNSLKVAAVSDSPVNSKQTNLQLLSSPVQ